MGKYVILCVFKGPISCTDDRNSSYEVMKVMKVMKGRLVVMCGDEPKRLVGVLQLQ